MLILENFQIRSSMIITFMKKNHFIFLFYNRDASKYTEDPSYHSLISLDSSLRRQTQSIENYSDTSLSSNFTDRELHFQASVISYQVNDYSDTVSPGVQCKHNRLSENDDHSHKNKGQPIP